MSDNPHLVVCGIGTGVGKTLVSTLLTAGLGATYWKPIQTGTDTGDSDTEWVRGQLNLPSERVWPERYALPLPESPHYAAEQAGTEIDDRELTVPPVQGPLIIEGAGGVMVPVNRRYLYIDLLQQWQLPVVVVSRLYLGAINHTLLTLEALEHRNVPVRGVVFNGAPYPSVEEVIPDFSPVPVLGRVPELDLNQPQDWPALFRQYIRL
jgi:dethiobiotin synthetase